MNFRISHTLSLLAATALTGLLASAARADDFLVTNILDAGTGSLRSAIEAANDNPGHDTVSFHPALSGNIQLSEVIWVHDPITIIGAPDGSIGFDTAGAFTPFGLLVQATEFGLVDLQFTNCPSAFGVHGHLRINLLRCSFVDNGGSSWGGVINQSPASQYRLSGIVQSCSFINNVGIYAGIMVSATPLAGDTLDFINCTICNNSATHGAGVYNVFTDNPSNSGTIRVINSTVTGNSGGVNSTAAFGAFHRFGGAAGQGSLLVRNSVFAENTSGDDQTDPNFSGFPEQFLSLVGANILSDPQLEPLSVVDGRHVRIPLPGSPCIDAAMPDSTVRADQLGTIRPFLAPGAVPAAGSNGADIGAIEFVPAPCAADFDGSGVVGVPDIFAFLSAWFAGCP